MEQQSEIDWLKHQLDESKLMIYGSKYERFIAPDPLQSKLFDLPTTEATEKKQEEITYTRTKPEATEKKHPLLAELPAHLPRKEEVIEPAGIPDSLQSLANICIMVLFSNGLM